ncbi:Nif11-like leader peptide family natural product precursor [Prochlorococcus marinus]|nr:Nif11-like leader peptide family natural product precursor [Prochlorococcus marinus]
MSEEQLKAFLEKVKGDTSLQEKLQAAADSDAVLAIAKEAGFMISADELKKAQSEISEEELESAAGGRLKSGCHCGTVIRSYSKYC